MLTVIASDPQAMPSGKRNRHAWCKVPLIVVGVLVLVSAVRLITGAYGIDSPGQMSSALRLAVPIGLAGLGGLWAERSGVVNIGLEGMMILGTWCGAWAGYLWGPWAGVCLGVIGGALGAVLHAVATVTFGANQIISGVAVNILAVGTTRYLSRFTFANTPQGSAKQSPPLGSLGTFSLPHLSAWLAVLSAKHWFLISDIAGLLGGLVTGLSPLTVVAVGLLPVTWWSLWRTGFGLRLRSCGENPVAAASLGVNVYKYRYIAVIVSGGCAGLGGAFLTIVASNLYVDGQTAGRGYIGLAAMISGNWRPGGLAMGAGLFGYMDSLDLRGGLVNVHALILLLALLLLCEAARLAWRRKYLSTGITVVIAGVALLWYATTHEVPRQLVTAAPYIVTLIVLAMTSQSLRMPKANGVPYRKGQER